MKLNPLEILKPTAILVAICVIVTGAVAGTDLLTRDRIAQQQALKAEESRMIVLPGAERFRAVDEERGVYAGLDSAEGHVGYTFETSAKGYGGDVKVMTGIALDGTVTGVVILEHEETPGLGANAEKESFRAQYIGLSGAIEVVRYQTPQGQQIEALTGASITSRAVTNAVNEALEDYRMLLSSSTMIAAGQEEENNG